MCAGIMGQGDVYVHVVTLGTQADVHVCTGTLGQGDVHVCEGTLGQGDICVYVVTVGAR